MDRRLGVQLDASAVAATIGSKELVAGLPHWLHLRTPDRDTVLYPEVSYPSYAMGATLAGCRPVAVPVDDRWRIDLGAIDPDDAARALCLWINTPGNPAGGLDDLDAAATWGRAHGVPVFSDECYVEFTWDGPRRTILTNGFEGLVAVHSLSKRSNFAGGRLGFRDDVRRGHDAFLREAAPTRLADDGHVGRDHLVAVGARREVEARVDEDLVADLDAGDARSDLRHDAREVRAADVGQRDLQARPAVAHEEVQVVERGRLHLHAHVAGPKGWAWQVADLHDLGAAVGLEISRLHGGGHAWGGFRLLRSTGRLAPHACRRRPWRGPGRRRRRWPCGPGAGAGPRR